MLYANLTGWLFDYWRELLRYFDRLSVTQWAVVAAAAVMFSFLCLKGHKIRD